MNYNYQQARSYLYPELYLICESLYPLASNGDSTKKAALDAHINLVNTTIPADSTEYTSEELIAKKTELEKDSAFLKCNNTVLTFVE